MDRLGALKDARNLIQSGWTRGDFYKNGRYCAMGAVKEVVESDDSARSFDFFYLLDYLSDILINDLESDYMSLSEWNDSQKSKKPVLELYDRAINKMESGDE